MDRAEIVVVCRELVGSSHGVWYDCVDGVDTGTPFTVYWREVYTASGLTFGGVQTGIDLPFTDYWWEVCAACGLTLLTDLEHRGCSQCTDGKFVQHVT